MESLDVLTRKIYCQNDMQIDSVHADTEENMNIAWSIRSSYGFSDVYIHFRAELISKKTQRRLDALRNLHVIFKDADTEWIMQAVTDVGKFFPSEKGALDSEAEVTKVAPVIADFCDVISTVGCVGEFPGREDIGFCRKDFPNTAARATLSMHLFLGFIETLRDNLDETTDAIKIETLYHISMKGLMIALEHTNSEYWTSKDSEEASSQLLAAIYKYDNCETLGQFFFKNQADIAISGKKHSSRFKILLNQLKPRLTKVTWKSNPSAKTIFSVCLLNVTFPHISDYLTDVLPPSLILIDDHQTDHKLLGVKCVHHIIKNTTASELTLYGRAEVIYQAMHPLIVVSSTQDSELLNHVLFCLHSLLPVVESNSSLNQDKPKPKHEDIYSRFLSNMEMEDKIVLRKIYSQHLLKLTTSMNSLLFKHMPRLMRVLINYIEVGGDSEEVTREQTLLVLREVIRITWPRFRGYLDNTIKQVLKLVFTLCDGHDELNETSARLVNMSAECVKLLRKAFKDQIDEDLKGLDSLSSSPAWLKFVSDLTKAE